MNTKLLTLAMLGPLSASYNAASFASDDPSASQIESVKRDDIYITGGADEVRSQPGSAHLIDEAEIEKFEYDDINRVLSHIPGVNIQEEEGYGLRPNIGLRGAHPHRSRKIALMEDAVLIGPAPYSAPAAYYFPMFAKMEGIEVFKGPSAIKYGPNTVGGAVNMVTRSIPETDTGRINLAYGSDAYSKAHIYYGQREDQYGWLIDGLNLRSDGFKDLDTGGDTGFNKSDITFKGMINSDFDADMYQQLELKLQYSDEDSDATYTGVTKEDFSQTPYRRYAASERDQMDAEHKQIMLTHYIEFDPTFSLTSIAYRNEFERTWSKLNGFNNAPNGPSLSTIFADSSNSEYQDYLKVLKGELNSADAGALYTLEIGNNAREYVSQGLQLLAHWDPLLAGVAHEFEFGARFHNDYIERNHTTDNFLMTDGRLVSDGSARKATTTNKDSTNAIALHVQDKISLDALTLTAGLRAEFIDNTREDRSGAGNPDIDNDDTVIIPGIGAFYQVTPEFGLLAGVNKGFSPVGPGQEGDIDPEESINYEAGMRYYQGAFSSELIGFYNDYSNIKGVCTFSSGCRDANIDQEFNGGEAEILGAEVTLAYQLNANDLVFPLAFNYTFTQAEFASNFRSNNPDWGQGDIKDGDTLPYIPDHQASFSTGVISKDWQTHLVAKYVGERNDTANEAVSPANRKLPGYTVFDLKANYQVNKDLQVYASVKNLFDKEYLTSLRPFGDRPGIPRQLLAGVKYAF